MCVLVRVRVCVCACMWVCANFQCCNKTLYANFQVRKTKSFDFFGTKLLKNGFRFGNPENWCRNLESVSSRYHVCLFSGKMDNFDFFNPNLLKINLGLEIRKTNVGIRISIFEISCVPIFRQNGQLQFFRSNYA